MTSELNNISPSSLTPIKAGSLIKISFMDSPEEKKSSSLFINGYSIIELDETNKDLYTYDSIPEIETKQSFKLKNKANYVENHYNDYSDDKVMNINCFKCLMKGFNKNELLYFKDKKSLISYLKYCFIFLKKNIFINHTIYMNNRFDLLKIDDTYFVGWHFLLSKTICKSCFIQLINKEYLFSKLKNEISDYESTIIKRTSNLLNIKRRRRKRISSIRKINQDNAYNNIGKNNKLKSIQISPIVIPLSNNEFSKKIKKRRSNSKNINRRVYNDNVLYDKINNVLIINKKILEKDNSMKHNKNKRNKNRFKSVKYVNISRLNSENINIKSLSNLDTTNREENKENKNTIIINNINNNTLNKENNTEINMNKVGLIQINNNGNINSNNNQRQIPVNFFLSKEKIIADCNLFWLWISNIIDLNKIIYQNMTQNNIKELYSFVNNELLKYLQQLGEIYTNINDNKILIEYNFYLIKEYIKFSENKFGDNNNDLYELKKKGLNLQEGFRIIFEYCLDGWRIIKNIIGTLSDDNKNNNIKYL